jgi:hypothetical protein
VNRYGPGRTRFKWRQRAKAELLWRNLQLFDFCFRLAIARKAARALIGVLRKRAAYHEQECKGDEQK